MSIEEIMELNSKREEKFERTTNYWTASTLRMLEENRTSCDITIYCCICKKEENVESIPDFLGHSWINNSNHINVTINSNPNPEKIELLQNQILQGIDVEKSQEEIKKEYSKPRTYAVCNECTKAYQENAMQFFKKRIVDSTIEKVTGEIKDEKSN